MKLSDENQSTFLSLSLCDLLVLFKELDHVVQGLVAVQYPEEIADPGDLSIKTGQGWFVSNGLEYRQNTCKISLL